MYFYNDYQTCQPENACQKGCNDGEIEIYGECYDIEETNLHLNTSYRGSTIGHTSDRFSYNSPIDPCICELSKL